MLSLLAGCKKSPPAARIAVVTNSASAPLAHILQKEKSGFVYSLTAVNLPNRARQLLADDECDVAVVPIETASILYKRANPKIKVIAGISIGGFELVSTKELADLSELKDGIVQTTERDTLMGNIFEYLLRLYDLNMPNDVSFNYADSLIAIQAALKDQTASYALLTSAEAALVKANVSGLKSYNLTDELAKKFKNPSIINYCVVATTSFINKKPKVLEQLITDIEAAYSADVKPADTIELAKKHELITNDACDEAFLASCKLKFISGGALKSKLTAYFKMLGKIKPSVANKIIDKDDFFYIAKK